MFYTVEHTDAGLGEFRNLSDAIAFIRDAAPGEWKLLNFLGDEITRHNMLPAILKIDGADVHTSHGVFRFGQVHETKHGRRPSAWPAESFERMVYRFLLTLPDPENYLAKRSLGGAVNGGD